MWKLKPQGLIPNFYLFLLWQKTTFYIWKLLESQIKPIILNLLIWVLWVRMKIIDEINNINENLSVKEETCCLSKGKPDYQSKLNFQEQL